MKNNYLVSICVPIYGVEKFIERCAISLFEQTYENIEYIFVNDCTKDNSMNVLKKVIERYPDKLHQVHIVTHIHNRGLGASRNTAISKASGDFIIHVDSDDYIAKEAVELLVDAQSQNNADIVFPSAFKVHKTYTELLQTTPCYNAVEYSKKLLTHKALGCIWGRLIRRSLYVNNQITVKEGINMGEDIQVIPILTYYAKIINFVQVPIYYYDCTFEGSYTNMYSKEKLNQDWDSLDIACDFFAAKGWDDVVKEAQLKNIVTHLVYSSHIKGISYYYEEAKRRLNLIPQKYWHLQPFQMRVILYLSNYRFLMNLYIYIARNLKQFVKYLKSLSCGLK